MNPDIQLTLPFFVSNITELRIVKPATKNKSMRWLGVNFDSCLSFSNHADIMASKGHKASVGLIMLANTVRRVDAKIMRRAVYVYIPPILTYATPAWWPGHMQINKNNKTIRNRINSYLKKLDNVQNDAFHAILLVWKTTPVKIMQKEAVTPPIRYTFDYLCELVLLRLHRLELQHPVRLRTKNCIVAQTQPG